MQGAPGCTASIATGLIFVANTAEALESTSEYDDLSLAGFEALGPRDGMAEDKPALFFETSSVSSGCQTKVYGQLDTPLQARPSPSLYQDYCGLQNNRPKDDEKIFENLFRGRKDAEKTVE